MSCNEHKSWFVDRPTRNANAAATWLVDGRDNRAHFAIIVIVTWVSHANSTVLYGKDDGVCRSSIVVANVRLCMKGIRVTIGQHLHELYLSILMVI